MREWYGREQCWDHSRIPSHWGRNHPEGMESPAPGQRIKGQRAKESGRKTARSKGQKKLIQTRSSCTTQHLIERFGKTEEGETGKVGREMLG